MRNILVTGGAGYLGSVLVRVLLEDGFQVIVTDNLLFGGESLLGVWCHPSFRFVNADLMDSERVGKLFAAYPIEGVVHLAAIVGDPACAKDPEHAKKVNLEAYQKILNLAMHFGVKRFVFASTCSNYGKMRDTHAYVDEYSELKPVSLYAELKVRCEQILLNELEKKDSFCPTVLRFATIYGVSPRMRFDLTVNEFAKELALGRELEVFGEQFWRPYCHVYDVARAVLLVLNSHREKVAYNVFNVGDTSENYTKAMIVEEVKKIIPAVRVRYIHKEEDPRDYRVSFEKIKRELEFTTTKRVSDGIREVYSLVQNNIIEDLKNTKYSNT